MAKIIADDLWLCPDCTIAAVNGDFTGMDDETAKRVREGLDKLCPEGGLVPDFDSETGEGVMEFSRLRCDSCDGAAGGRNRFAILK